MKKFNRDYEKKTCPVCGKNELLLFDVCEECGWENDPVQSDDPEYKGGANEMSLKEARAAYAEGKHIQ